VALKSLSSNNCNFIEDYSNNGLNLDELFGLFYCEVKTNDQYLRLLANGKFNGVWFSEELKFARDNSYKIKVIKGYNFYKATAAREGIFYNYITELYKTKANSTGSIKAITKNLLNSLLGRFGISITKSVTEIVDINKLDRILFIKFLLLKK